MRKLKNGLIILSLFLCFPAYSDDRDYYSIISDNSLFLPLGWTKPDNSPKFKLISTVIGDDTYGILSNNRNKLKLVRVGDSLLGNKVASIQSYLVEMENGTRYELERLAFLSWKTREKGRKTAGRDKGTSISAKSSTSGESEVNTQTSSGTSRRRSRRGSRQRQRISPNMIEKWRNASPGERQEMIEAFTKRAQRGSDSREDGK